MTLEKRHEATKLLPAAPRKQTRSITLVIRRQRPAIAHAKRAGLLGNNENGEKKRLIKINATGQRGRAVVCLLRDQKRTVCVGGREQDARFFHPTFEQQNSRGLLAAVPVEISTQPIAKRKRRRLDFPNFSAAKNSICRLENITWRHYT